MIIHDWNKIYTYFQLIRELRPTSILDIGMLLKRSGCLSRRTMSFESLDDVRLEGIDIMPEYQFKVYAGIYDKIYDIDKIEQLSDSAYYDMITMFQIRGVITKEEENQLFEYALSHSRYLIADLAAAQEQFQRGMNLKYRDVTVGDAHYALIETN